MCILLDRLILDRRCLVLQASSEIEPSLMELQLSFASDPVTMVGREGRAETAPESDTVRKNWFGPLTTYIVIIALLGGSRSYVAELETGDNLQVIYYNYAARSMSLEICPPLPAEMFSCLKTLFGHKSKSTSHQESAQKSRTGHVSSTSC